jgi:predicted transcriptional regulator
MPRKPVAVTETELAILEVLWSRGQATSREIVEAIYGQHSASLHATVNSLIDRLREKGYVAVDPSGFSHRYSVTVDRGTTTEGNRRPAFPGCGGAAVAGADRSGEIESQGPRGDHQDH